MKDIAERAASRNRHIVFPESEDPRVLKAVQYLCENSLCSVSVIGKKSDVLMRADNNEIAIPDTVRYLDFQNWDQSDKLADYLFNRRKHKGLKRKEVEQLLEDPLFFAASAVGYGYADGCVAGSVATTGQVIQAALQCIGMRDEVSIVSSIFLMAMPDNRVFTYGDCGVVPYPDKDQLADIAIESARTHELLTEQKPVVAMLSFSTKGSADHERVHLVRDALGIVRKKTPDLVIDGEFQFDAALLPEVAGRKAPESEVAGHANVFIFPNLDAGNIAYKITERLGGATATGPILQGLAKPMMDLSRGCGWMDIVNAACVAVLMGEND